MSYAGTSLPGMRTIDEDELVLPAALPQPYPRRPDATGVPAPDTAEAARVADAMRRHGARVREIVADAETPAEIREADPASPLGAASIAVSLIEAMHKAGENAWPEWVEVWAVERGLPFTVRAFTEYLFLWTEVRYDDSREFFRYVARKQFREFPWADGRERLRLLVTAAPDDVYAEVLTALSEIRASGDVIRRALASFLAPGQRDWVAADVKEAVRLGDDAAARLLLSCAWGDVAMLEELHDLTHHWAYVRNPQLLATLLSEVPGWVCDKLVAADPWDEADKILAYLPYDAAFRRLHERVDDYTVRPHLYAAADRFPGRAVRVLAEGPGHKHTAAVLREYVIAYPEIASRQPDPDGRIAEIRAELAAVPDADPALLPAVLREPPWQTPVEAAPEAVVMAGLRCTDPVTVSWLPGEREGQLRRYTYERDWEAEAAWASRGERDHERLNALLCCAPDELVRPLLGVVDIGGHYWSKLLFSAALARFEADALPLMEKLPKGERLGEWLLPFSSPALAALFAAELDGGQARQELARRWFERHAPAAARALVPAALGKAAKARRQAIAALRILDERVVRAAAESYAPGLADALLPQLAPPPERVKEPFVTPRLATGVVLPLLAGGSTRVPRTHAVVLAKSLAGGLLPELDGLDRDDLRRYAWEAFTLWRLSGCDPRDGWTMEVLAHLGDERTARDLADLILLWPGEAGHARAVKGLGVLAGMNALGQLNRVAQRAKFKGLKNTARQKMDEVAAGLGLTGEQLADRLVPDFGLAADGTLTLDYGPRRFVAGFDEALRPWFTDGSGRRLKALPKPGVNDDPAAYRAFAEVRKESRKVAQDLITGLERAMVEQRRWRAGEFRTHLAGHPFTGILVRRLLFVLTDGTVFRVAEDGTFADVHDDTLTVGDDAELTVAHPLHFAGQARAWLDVFADYQLLQPFDQLKRPFHERSADGLAALQGRGADGGRLLKLEKRGWRMADPQDAGSRNSIERPLPGGGSLEVALNPGMFIGEAPESQTLQKITLRGGPAGLDDVTYSELVHDLTWTLDE